MLNNLAPYRSPGPLISDPISTIARTVADIVAMRTQFADRCDARERVAQVIRENLADRDREGRVRLAAFNRVMDLATSLVSDGHVAEAVVLVGHASRVLGEPGAPLLLPGGPQ